MQNKKIVSSDLASKIVNLNIFQAILGQNSVHLGLCPKQKGGKLSQPLPTQQQPFFYFRLQYTSGCAFHCQNGGFFVSSSFL